MRVRYLNARRRGDESPETVSHPLCARLYAKQSEAAESRGVADQRGRMLAGLAGEVVEIGAGNGLNFFRYPQAVTWCTPSNPTHIFAAWPRGPPITRRFR